jgi:Protein of unknown function (DUF1549)/Protein of unknown function (DUF1553)
MSRSTSVMLLLVLLAVLVTTYTAQQLTTPAQAPTAGQNPDAVEEAHRGLLTPKTNPGEEAARSTDQLSKGIPAGGEATAKIPRRNFIDEHIFGRIERDNIPHAGMSTDQEFIRRVYVDATGVLPTAQQVREFVGDKSANKRDKLIDSLIGTEEFAEEYAWFWGDLFRIAGDTGYGRDIFQNWNKEWLLLDRPYNEVVFDLLTPASKAHNTVPALGFIGRINLRVCHNSVDPDDYRMTNRLDVIDELATEVNRIFLGVNSTCITCHDGAGHLEPLNMYLASKTREEFHRNAAFFGQMRSLATTFANDDQVIDDLGPGYDTGHDAPFITKSIMYYPRDGRVYEPAFLLTGEKPRAGQNLRAEYARIMTGHIQFARATVNLLWGRLMTVGFVQPYDGFDMARLGVDPKVKIPKPWTVQPTNPELMEAMAVDFQKSNFSIQHVIKTIMKSNAYQLSSKFPAEWKDEYTPYYARKYIRFMTAPEVLDAIAGATNRPMQFTLGGEKLTRVKQLTYPGQARGSNGGDKTADFKALLQAFFQGDRATQSQDGNRPTTLQALAMTNLELVNKRVLAEKGSRVQQLVESNKSDTDIIDEMFLSTLARWPTPQEREVMLQLMEKDRKTGAETTQWVLLNSMEFVLNH